MASILNVDKIRRATGTDALVIDSSDRITTLLDQRLDVDQMGL